MKRKYSLFPGIFLLLFILFGSSSTNAAIPSRTGWWKFDNPLNLRKAEAGYGSDLTLTGTQTAVNGPESGNGAVQIGIGSYYKMQHHIPANGGGSFVNEYSLQYDFKVPALGVWHSFFQTAVNNDNDGDLFINPSGNIGVGVVGYSAYAINANEWYRMIVSVKNGSFFNCYLDGKLLLSGNLQAIDGRFSLENLLLIFADENGEDANIYCSELAIWNQALTADQASELGGYSHDIGSFLMTRIPYLQAPGTNTMTVCWHDIALTGTKIIYGVDSTAMNQQLEGTNELISDPYRWHTVKITGLKANTRYFYRVSTSDGESGIYSFKTLPDQSYSGKLRYILLSDTHAMDTTMAGEVLRAARTKITELYGPDIENHINGIFHSGDIVVSGSTPAMYSSQYFGPLSALSSNIPTMVVAGNHEVESPYFYNYLKLDDQSAFPLSATLKEKIWQIQEGNTLFIGLNTNIIDQYGETQANWLDTRLSEAEQDAGIDFVFVFFHHPPISELWVVGGTDYVQNRLIPVMKKYSKVQEIHYGHTHGYERGTITSDMPGGDFRMICGGGGGGPLDPWAEGEIKDYQDIHITISNYFFQLLEIDVANHSYRNSMYSLGTPNKPLNALLLDTWHKSKNQPGPGTPSIENIERTGTYVQFTTSIISGVDSLMSVHFQVIENAQNTAVVIDSVTHWENMYNVDQNSDPIDLNNGINLYHSKIDLSRLSDGKDYLFRVRYRDQNLKWSNWSPATSFTTTGIQSEHGLLYDKYLDQNFPNPFKDKTSIKYTIPEKTEVIFRFYDFENRLIDEINEGIKPAGTYNLIYNSGSLPGETLVYKLITHKFTTEKKMIKIR